MAIRPSSHWVEASADPKANATPMPEPNLGLSMLHMIMHYTHIWPYDHILYLYMVIRACIIPKYGHMIMHYPHIWSYDHALYPYMVICAQPRPDHEL